MIRKIAVLTSGGDAPGMNAAVRAVIRAGLYVGKEMYVIYDGYRGLVEGNIHQVNKDFTQDIINRGGTIIKSARLPEFKEPEVLEKALQRLSDYDIDATGYYTFIKSYRDPTTGKVLIVKGNPINDLFIGEYKESVSGKSLKYIISLVCYEAGKLHANREVSNGHIKKDDFETLIKLTLDI